MTENISIQGTVHGRGHFLGREKQIRDFNLQRDNVAKLTGRASSYIWVHGEEGYGKSTLLKEFHGLAEKDGWTVVAVDGEQVEGRKRDHYKLRRQVETEARKKLGLWSRVFNNRVILTVLLFVASHIPILKFDGAALDKKLLKENLRPLLRKLGKIAKRKEVGVLLTINNIGEQKKTDVIPELKRLRGVIDFLTDHDRNSNDRSKLPLPILVVLASSTPYDEMSKPFKEHCMEMEIEKLSEQDTIEALKALLGNINLPESLYKLAYACTEEGRPSMISVLYKHFLNRCGDFTSEITLAQFAEHRIYVKLSDDERKTLISAEFAKKTLADPAAEMARKRTPKEDSNLKAKLKAMWDKYTTSPKVKRVLRALAEKGDGAHHYRDVAALLGDGVSANDIGQYKRILIRDGIINGGPKGSGLMEFEDIGFRDYVVNTTKQVEPLDINRNKKREREQKRTPSADTARGHAGLNATSVDADEEG